jgi:O-acetylserine/cysteine efflux transporter
VLGDLPTHRQIIGMACVGLALIGSTVGLDFTVVGLSLTLGAALTWAIGNVLVKQTAPGVPMLPLAFVSPMNRLPFFTPKQICDIFC